MQASRWPARLLALALAALPSPARAAATSSTAPTPAPLAAASPAPAGPAASGTAPSPGAPAGAPTLGPAPSPDLAATPSTPGMDPGSAPPVDPSAAAPAGPSPGADVADDDPRALQDFQPRLAPYGSWIQDPRYGLVWVPSRTIVGGGFSPYVTGGRWALDSNNDWVWVSSYPFGPIVFHYGRWVWGSYGWSWIAGYRYAPAWVAWRVPTAGYAYVGWAPMAPSFYWAGGFAVGMGYPPPYYWVFCPSAYLFSPYPYPYIVTQPVYVQTLGRHTRQYAPAAPGIARGPSLADARVPPGSAPGTRLPAAPRVAGPVPAPPASRSFDAAGSPRMVSPTISPASLPRSATTEHALPASLRPVAPPRIVTPSGDPSRFDSPTRAAFDRSPGVPGAHTAPPSVVWPGRERMDTPTRTFSPSPRASAPSGPHVYTPSPWSSRSAGPRVYTPSPSAPGVHTPSPRVYTPSPRVYTPSPRVYTPSPRVYTPSAGPHHVPSPHYSPAPSAPRFHAPSRLQAGPSRVYAPAPRVYSAPSWRPSAPSHGFSIPRGFTGAHHGPSRR